MMLMIMMMIPTLALSLGFVPLTLLIFTVSVITAQQQGSATSTSRLQVLLPQSLKSNNSNGYRHVDALFGRGRGRPPSWTSGIQGRTASGSSMIVLPFYYAESDFCQRLVMTNNSGNKNATTVPTTTFYPFSPVISTTATSIASSPLTTFLLMVNRGGNCSFVQKVRNAQYMGAAGVLIADNTCRCADQECIEFCEMETCELQDPVLTDNGSGSDISIPSLLIYKKDAEMFKKYLKTSNQTMRVQLEFPGVPGQDAAADDDNDGGPNNVVANNNNNIPSSTTNSSSGNTAQSSMINVSYELWMSPADLLSNLFLQRFQSAALALRTRTIFTPHYTLYNGSASGCSMLGEQQNSKNESSPCYSLCTNHGRYCGLIPDSLVYGSFAALGGAGVVEESLRQLCVYSQAYRSGSSSNPALWWSYVTEYQQSCARSSSNTTTQDCLGKVYEASGVSHDLVEQCISNSGGLIGNVPNNKLDTELTFLNKYGIHVIPMLFINDMPYKGPLTAEAVFGALCDEFPVRDKPALCLACAQCPTRMDCVQQKGSCITTTTLVLSGQPARPLNRNHDKGSTVVATVSNGLARTSPASRHRHHHSGVPVVTFLSSILGIVFLTASLALWFREFERREMRKRVRTIMADYMRLDDENIVSYNQHNNFCQFGSAGSGSSSASDGSCITVAD